MGRIDFGPVGKGALVAGAVGLCFGLGGRALPEGSSLAFLFALIIFAGMGVGGFVAGREQPEVALTAGGYAAGLAAIALQVLNLAIGAARGTLGVSSIITVIFTVLVCTSMGSIGGYIAFRRAVGSRP